ARGRTGWPGAGPAPSPGGGEGGGEGASESRQDRPPSPGAPRAPTSPRWGEVEQAALSCLNVAAAVLEMMDRQRLNGGECWPNVLTNVLLTREGWSSAWTMSSCFGAGRLRKPDAAYLSSVRALGQRLISRARLRFSH